MDHPEMADQIKTEMARRAVAFGKRYVMLNHFPVVDVKILWSTGQFRNSRIPILKFQSPKCDFMPIR